jgi:hypothetical protein
MKKRCKTSRRTRCKTRCSAKKLRSSAKKTRSSAKKTRSSAKKLRSSTRKIKKLGKSRKFKKRKIFFGGIVLTDNFTKLQEYFTPEIYKKLTEDEKKLYAEGEYYKNENNDYDYISTEKYKLLKEEEKNMYNTNNVVKFYKKKETNEPYNIRTKAVQSDLANQKILEERRLFIDKEEGAVEMNFEDTDLSEYQQQGNYEHGTNIKYRKPVIDIFKTNYDEAYLDAVDQLKDQIGFPPPDKHFDSLNYTLVIYWEKEIMTEIFGTDKQTWNLKYLPKKIVNTSTQNSVYFTPKLLDHIMNNTPLEVAGFAPGFATDVHDINL